jgi:hypothetical protein
VKIGERFIAGSWIRTFHARMSAVEVDVSLTRARVVGVLEQLVIGRGALAVSPSTMGRSSIRDGRTRGPTSHADA